MAFNGRKGESMAAQHCPICGRNLTAVHRCPQSVLGAIDAANTRAEDDEDSPVTREPFYRDYSARLSEGFSMMRGDGDD